MKETISRQRAWQIEKKKKGLCVICGKKKVRTFLRCRSCREKIRNYNNRKKD